MKQFSSIEKIDTGILYALELASSISVLLLAFGLIASMANVLTKGSVLTDNLLMQRVWAWTQCIAIDASVAGTIIRTFRYQAEGAPTHPFPKKPVNRFPSSSYAQSLGLWAVDDQSPLEHLKEYLHEQ